MVLRTNSEPLVIFRKLPFLALQKNTPVIFQTNSWFVVSIFYSEVYEKYGENKIRAEKEGQYHYNIKILASSS